VRPLTNSALRARLPFLVAAFLSFLLSVWLYFVADQQMEGIFVGVWVPSILSLGLLFLAPVETSARLKRVKVRK